MTEQKAIEILKNNYPLTCKLVDGRYKGGFKDYDSLLGKAITMAISALEEIQQYREIERDLERYHANVDIPRLIRHFIDTVFEGEKHEGFCILTNEDANAWEAYKAIGTVEECREAMEKQRAKKIEPIGLFERCYCPNCLGKIQGKSEYCPKCGQKED